MSEVYYCPLTGDRPHPAPLPHGWEWTADALRELEALRHTHPAPVPNSEER